MVGRMVLPCASSSSGLTFWLGTLWIPPLGELTSIFGGFISTSGRAIRGGFIIEMFVSMDA